MAIERFRVEGLGTDEELAVRVSGAGPPVLLLHGIPGSSGAWMDVVPQLVQAGFQVLVPDLLGFGASSRPRTVEDLWIGTQARALATALHALGGRSVLVVGHDYGAPISVELARQVPTLVSGLVLASGNLFTDTPIPLPLRSLRLPFLGEVAAAAALSSPSLRLMLRFGSGRPRPTLDSAVYLGDHSQRAAIRAIFATALRELESRYAEVEEFLPGLGKPVIMLWGSRDPFFSVEEGRRAAAVIPGAELRVAQGAGHFLPAERPDLFCEAVVRLSSPNGKTG